MQTVTVEFALPHGKPPYRLEVTADSLFAAVSQVRNKVSRYWWYPIRSEEHQLVVKVRTATGERSVSMGKVLDWLAGKEAAA
jgi:uncharacterized protein involved in tolerance to divalent cations